MIFNGERPDPISVEYSNLNDFKKLISIKNPSMFYFGKKSLINYFLKENKIYNLDDLLSTIENV